LPSGDTGHDVHALRLEAQVVHVVANLVAEKNGALPLVPIHRSTVLESDLGLFSLERVELVRRLQAALGRELPEEHARNAKRVGDLVCLALGEPPDERDATETVGGDLPRVHTRSAPRSAAFTAYVAVLLLFIGAVVWVLMLLVRRKSTARLILRRSSRAVLRASRCPVKVIGLEHLQGRGPAVLVANHLSYADSFVLVATLPIDLNVVANEGLPAAPLIGAAIRSARYLVIDRASFGGRVASAAAMADALREGDSLLVFPEGTISDGPEPLPFRLGPFSAAVETGRPVIPVTLRGTREILPFDRWMLRRGPVSVTIHPPIHPSTGDWTEMLRLRQRAESQVCGLDG
jgi:1-acyl-sn-glycerol-3-phosphate acyltransferase